MLIVPKFFMYAASALGMEVELFFEAIFFRLKKSGNVQPDPWGTPKSLYYNLK